MSARSAGALAALIGGLVVAAPLARAEKPTSDEADPKPRAIDPGVASGPYITYATRPLRSPELRACSSRVPICVHASSPGDGATATMTLDAFERAWQTLTGALAIPAPDVDPTTLAYDVFLVEPPRAERDARARGAIDPPAAEAWLRERAGAELATTWLEARDVRSRVDRARGFTTVDRRVRAGCVLDELAATMVARASLLRAAPATEEGTARAQSTYLAQLASPCAVGLAVDATSAFQSRATRAFADPHAGEVAATAGGAEIPAPAPLSALFAAGAAAFWARLDWAFGRKPGGIVAASWALHPTMTPVASPRWINEPDTFDVLRTTFKGALSTNGTVHDLWLDFGVARAFLGSADDGFHLPELRTLGDAARVPLDWDIPWPEAPRRLAAREPVHPTGASYLVIRRAGARPGARLRVEIAWEEHALFRWAFVKLDAGGRELGRVVIPTTERATEAQMTLVDLDGVDRVLLVGVNVGDPAYAFDPDDEVWEPHGWLVTVAEEL
ncbi:MAG: hypothetical protein KF894_12720 [Labilithrix sp.]|nr:hypothetical protein [Labilithrix sp.]